MPTGQAGQPSAFRRPLGKTSWISLPESSSSQPRENRGRHPAELSAPSMSGGHAILSRCLQALSSLPGPVTHWLWPLGLHSAQWAPGALTSLSPCEELGPFPASLQLHHSPSRCEALVCTSPTPQDSPLVPLGLEPCMSAPAGPELLSTPPAVTLWTLSQWWAGLGPPAWQGPVTGAPPARVRAQEPCGAWGSLGSPVPPVAVRSSRGRGEGLSGA